MDTKIPGPVWPAAETPKTITLGLLSWDRAAVANSLLRLRFPKSCSSRPYRVNTVGTAWKQNKPEWVFARLLLGAALNKHWRVRLGRYPREPVSHPRSHWGSAESTQTDCWACLLYTSDAADES